MYKILESFSPNKLEDYLKISCSNLLHVSEKINYLINQILSQKKEKISSNYKQLSILSYKQTLKRGYAVARKRNKIIMSDSEVKKNDRFEVEFFNDKTLVKKI